MGQPSSCALDHVPYVERLCPHCRDPGFESNLWPFAAGHPPLSNPTSCHLSDLPCILKPRKNNNEKVLIIAIV